MPYVIFVLGIAISIGIAVFMKKQNKIDGIKAMVITSLLIALVLEIFTFNFTAYDMTNYSAKQTYKTKAKKDTQNTGIKCQYLRVDEDDVNAIVKHMQFKVKTNAPEVKTTITFSDDATKLPRNLAEIKICPYIKKTMNVSPDFSGKLHKLGVSFSVEGDYSIKSAKVTLNTKPAFKFRILRFILVFGILFILLLFAKTYKKSYGKSRAETMSRLKKAILVVAIIQILFSIGLVRAHRYDMNIISDKGGSDYYQEITQALASGHVDLNSLPYNQSYVAEIDKLEKLDNVYDTKMRDGINYKFDHAYYNGKYYCYYGIVPTLVAYLPVYLLTGQLLNTVFVGLLFVIGIIIAMACLIYNIFKRIQLTNIWLAVIALCGWISISMIHIVSMWFGEFGHYEIPRLGAMMFAIIGINLIYNSVRKGKIIKWKVAMGALCMAFTVGCRPNYVFVSLIPILIFVFNLYNVSKTEFTSGLKLIEKVKVFFKAIFRKENIKPIICFIAPYVVVAIGLMIYNYVRFDSPFEFGAKYQLTVYDTGAYHFDNFAKIPEVIYQFIFSMPVFSGIFPFLKPDIQKTEYLGYQFACSNVGVLTFPFIWIIALVPWSIRNKLVNLKEKIVVIACVLIGLLCLYTTAVLGAVGMEYYTDFAWILGLAVVMLLAFINKYSSPKVQQIATKTALILVLITIGVIFCICLSDSVGNGGIYKKNAGLFYMIKSMVMFWK